MLVLTYHSISSGPPPLCVRPEALAEHIALLRAAGYRTAKLADLAAALERAERPDPKSFLVTFDDGYRDFGDTAWPVLRELGVRPVLFAVTTATRDELAGGMGAPLLSLDELARLADEGVDLGAHSVGHVDLTRASDSELEDELGRARTTLAELCGGEIDALAYPFGAFDERVRRAAARHYRIAFTTQLAATPRRAEPSAIPRIDAYYLDAGWLRSALQRNRLDSALAVRRWLRRLRGSEPRLAIPRRERAA